MCSIPEAVRCRKNRAPVADMSRGIPADLLKSVWVVRWAVWTKVCAVSETTAAVVVEARVVEARVMEVTREVVRGVEAREVVRAVTRVTWCWKGVVEMPI